MDSENQKKRKTSVIVLIVIATIFATGIVLQFVTGGFDFSLLAFPVNLLLLLIFIFISAIRPTSPVAKFGTLPVSLALIALLAALSLLMGLIPGNTIKSSWPFVLAYLMLMINLSMTIGRRLRNFRLCDTGFMFNHAGLFILLFSAGFGRGDMKRYFVTVAEGMVEWRGQNAWNGRMEELPVTVKLNDFIMDQYPAEIMILSGGTGELPEEKEACFTEAKPGSSFNAGNWLIRVDSLLDREGYALAAFVTAMKAGTVDTLRGWVSCGNYLQEPKYLMLDKTLSVVMTVPAPKSFSSEVEINTKKGFYKRGTVKVNHPLTAGSWKIYQHSYDTKKGRDSEYSVFELVHDPWIIPAWTGIFMLFAGAVTLFWKGGRTK
jgi:hypothetical protein